MAAHVIRLTKVPVVPWVSVSRTRVPIPRPAFPALWEIVTNNFQHASPHPHPRAMGRFRSGTRLARSRSDAGSCGGEGRRTGCVYRRWAKIPGFHCRDWGDQPWTVGSSFVHCGFVDVAFSCHPAVTDAVMRQVGSLVHMQCSLMFSAPYLQLIERLLPAMPHPSLDQFFLWNSGASCPLAVASADGSGAEAVEAAVKVARKATGRPNIICFQGSYHGRTYGSGALTRSKPIYTQSTGPLMVRPTSL